MRLKDHPIKTRLLINSGVLLLLFILALLLYNFALNVAQATFNDVLLIEHTVSDKSAIIGLKIQQSRKDEKNFRLKLDKKYIEKAFDNLDEVIRDAASIKKFATAKGYAHIISASGNLITHSSAYRDILHKIVNIYEYKGLTPDSGLRGRFRKAGHTLFDRNTMEHAVGDILAGISTLHLEQQSIRIHDAEGVTTFKEQLKNFANLLNRRQLSPQTANNLMDIFAEYKAAANLAMSGTNEPSLIEMEQDIDHMAAIILPIFVPDVRALVLRIRQHEKDYLIRGGQQHVDLTHQAINDLLTTFENAGIAREHIIDIEETLKIYVDNFDALVEKDKTLAQFDAQLTTEDKAMQVAMTEISNQSGQQIAAARRQMTSLTSKMTRISVAVCMVAVLMAIFFTTLITNSIVTPLQIFMASVIRMRDGDYTARIVTDSKDEIGQLSGMFNKMAALIEDNAWHATGRSFLADELRGDQDEKTLCRAILVALAKHINAAIGTLYTTSNDGNLKLTATYSFSKNNQLPTVIAPGSGLVGEAARAGKAILLSDVPEDYIRIESSLGSSIPRNIIALPLAWQGKVLGVVELASLTEFSESQQDFLAKSSESIAIAINSSRQRERTQTLLAESQRQSEELQVQQEELQAANEEMEEKNQVLAKSEDLLKSQQEELQASNEELEEKSEALILQKEAIQKKNADLETARLETEKKAQELAASSRYKSEFLANMSHELRTPLNSILILSQLLAKNKEKNLTDKELKFANTINSSGNDLLNLINEVLDLAKVESGHMQITSEEIDLGDLLDDMERIFAPLAADKNISLKLQIKKAAPQRIISDPQRLQQIIKNLLSNAIKFTDQGGVTLSIDRPQPDDFPKNNLNPDQSLAIIVTDTGIGIAPDKQDLVFQAFQQEDGTTSRKYGGTGLGLSIAREMALFLGGEISLKSTAGKGATFTLLLPLTINSAQPPTTIPTAIKQTPQPTNVIKSPTTAPPLPPGIKDDRRKIKKDDRVLLIIEDDPNFAGILLDLARQRGFKALIATDGESGLQCADFYQPNAIILDVGLPRIDGWEVMDRLKDNSHTRHIPVHFISATDHPHNGMLKGAIGFLTKPVSEEDMQTAMAKIEQVINQNVKNLLIVEDDETQRQSIIELIGSDDVVSTAVGSGAEALELIKSLSFDCMILDLGLSDMSGFELLEKIRLDTSIPKLPIIIYTGRDLTGEEQTTLDGFAESIIIKGARSPERLLAETTLFLHRVETDLPEAQRQMISNVQKRESLLNERKILIVDDDMRNVFALSSVLQEKGMQILVGKTGIEALAILKSNPDVDIVLMDIMMPEMDGFEAMEKIRSQPKFKNLPIIALTAKAMKGDRNKCIDAGANDYLAKPVDADRLLSLLRVWLYK